MAVGVGGDEFGKPLATYQELGQTLQSLGVSPEDAKKATAQAKKEVEAANKVPIIIRGSKE